MNGLETKYLLSKADGSPVDPSAEYFVLKFTSTEKDNEIDKAHVKASILAINMYALSIEKYLPELAQDLLKKYPINVD